MEIQESQVSCGVQELLDVGENPTLEAYEYAMAEGAMCNSHLGLGCFIVASVPWKWKNAVKFLKRQGFKSAGGVRVNPNSKNKIALFCKTLTAVERKKFAGNRCKECDEYITGPNTSRRRICDYCKTDKKLYGY